MSTSTSNSTLLETAVYNSTQVVNFALNSGKLLSNGSDTSGRVLMANNNPTNATISLPIILILIFILASIVGVIVTALFVMRNRFSTWRLDRSKSSPADAEEGIKAEQSENKPVEAKTDNTESDSPLINKEEEEETPVTKTTTTETAPVEGENVTNEETSAVAAVSEETETLTVGKEVVTSSSSLIVNVLNELSESVACKLESMDPEKEPLQSETKSD